MLPSVPKLKKIEALSYTKEKFNAAVPGAWLAKSNVSVSQVSTTVVRASVSTLLAGSVLSSTFRRTGVPAWGEYTRTVICVEPGANGTGLAKPAAPPIVVPAHSSAPSGLIVLTTVLAGSNGSGSPVISEILPPKSVRP